jgi:hypothetical protein
MQLKSYGFPLPVSVEMVPYKAPFVRFDWTVSVAMRRKHTRPEPHGFARDPRLYRRVVDGQAWEPDPDLSLRGAIPQPVIARSKPQSELLVDQIASGFKEPH